MSHLAANLYFYPDPKRPAYSRVQNGIRYIGDREICETQAAWNRRREELHTLKAGRCEGCRRMVPLHDEKNALGDVIRYAGQADHIIGRGMGGARRDDRLSNLRLLCFWCHNRRHAGAKPCPRKVRA